MHGRSLGEELCEFGENRASHRRPADDEQVLWLRFRRRLLCNSRSLGPVNAGKGDTIVIFGNRDDLPTLADFLANFRVEMRCTLVVEQTDHRRLVERQECVSVSLAFECGNRRKINLVASEVEQVEDHGCKPGLT